MGFFAAIVFAAAGALFIVKRNEVTWLQKAAIGARLPSGCAVAEGVALLVAAVAVLLMTRAGWF